MSTILNKPRFRGIVQTISNSLGLTEKFVENSINQHNTFLKLDAFLAGEGASKIFVYYNLSKENANAEIIITLDKNEIFCTVDVAEKPEGKVLCFERKAEEGKPVNVEIGFDDEVLFEELSCDSLMHANSILKEVNRYQEEGLDLKSCDQEKSEEILLQANKVVIETGKLVQSLVHEIKMANDDNAKKKVSEKDKLDCLQRCLSKYHKGLEGYSIELNNIAQSLTEFRRDFLSHSQIVLATHLSKRISKDIEDLSSLPITSREFQNFLEGCNSIKEQLFQFEVSYFDNWKVNIQKTYEGLQDNLIIQYHQEDGSSALSVNLDLIIFELIREAKYFERSSYKIPEEAKNILQQEEKLKMRYNELIYLFEVYTQILDKISPSVLSDILNVHINDFLELKVRPGIVTLTWNSTDIDAYLEQVRQGLDKLEQLIASINDTVENRIENNIKIISKVLLIDLENSEPIFLQQFISKQQEYIKGKKKIFMAKSVEIGKAVDDLLEIILTYPLDDIDDSVISTLQEEAKKIKSYYANYMSQALFNSVYFSLKYFKLKVTSNKSSSKHSNALFKADIYLNDTVIEINPSLKEIQNTINTVTKAILNFSNDLPNYKNYQDQLPFLNIVLCLYGSVQTAQGQINEVLNKFNQYSWLWKASILESLEQINEQSWSILPLEEKLKVLNETEQALEAIDPVFNAGPLTLRTGDLKQSLLVWINEWKSAYAQNLARHGQNLVDQLGYEIKRLQDKIRKEAKDLYSLAIVVESLDEIRKQEASQDLKFILLDDIYNLYNKFLPNNAVNSKEIGTGSLIKNNWKTLVEESEIKRNELILKQDYFLKELKADLVDFVDEVAKFRKEFENNGPIEPGITPTEAIERLKIFEDVYKAHENRSEINRVCENLFGLSNQKYPALEQTNVEIKNLRRLYDLYFKAIKSINEWKETAWCDLNWDLLYEMEEVITEFRNQCIRLPKNLKTLDIYKNLRQQLDLFCDSLPLIMALRKPSIRSRHWNQVIDIIGKSLNYEREDEFYLKDLFEANLLAHNESIEEIADSADKQLKIQYMISEITETWSEICFQINRWRGREGPCVFNGTRLEEIMERLEEDLQTLTTLNSQSHSMPFRKDIQEMTLTLSNVSVTLDQWVNVQILWTNLETALTVGDIAMQMQKEASIFENINRIWLQIMQKATEINKVILCCKDNMIKASLPGLKKELDLCQKSLEKYLESKRKAFPRFYFVSSLVLLKILSLESDFPDIQDDIAKIFYDVSRVRFERVDRKLSSIKMITHIISIQRREEEIYQLASPVKCIGNAEIWLGNLEKELRATLKGFAEDAWKTCLISPFTEIINKYPPQIDILILQMIWTYKMEEALRKRATDEKFWTAKANEIDKILTDLILLRQSNIISNYTRTRLETLTTIHVHQRDVTASIQAKDQHDFEWQKQTRIYWMPEINDISISVADWDSPYYYEYLGLRERLAITPITEKCYLTMTEAMRTHYSGALLGADGTGKTETVKDLGRTLGMNVVAFNCNIRHQYSDLVKVFKGVCQTGMWICFDGFNSLETEIISTVTQLIGTVTMAKRQRLEQFCFPGESDPTKLVQSAAYFIIEKADLPKNYQSLEENLKRYFRDVTMVVPDMEIIIKFQLAWSGFGNFAALATKIKLFYKLCERKLSKQNHYDFSLNNIRPGLNTLDERKRREPWLSDEELLMSTIRHMHLANLRAQDAQVFELLLNAVFA